MFLGLLSLGGVSLKARDGPSRPREVIGGMGGDRGPWPTESVFALFYLQTLSHLPAYHVARIVFPPFPFLARFSQKTVCIPQTIVHLSGRTKRCSTSYSPAEILGLRSPRAIIHGMGSGRHHSSGTTVRRTLRQCSTPRAKGTATRRIRRDIDMGAAVL